MLGNNRLWFAALVVWVAACGPTSRESRDGAGRVESAILPSGWGSVDIGKPGVSGSDSYAAGMGAYTLTGAGTGQTNWYQGNTNGYFDDQFHYVYRQATGDFEVVVRLVALGGALTQAGISIRADPNSPPSLTAPHSATIFYSPASSSDSPPQDVIQGLVRTVNVVPQGPTTLSQARCNCPWPTRPNPSASPVWLKMVRSQGGLGSYWSRDGVVWIPIETGGAFVDPGPVYVGMYVSSNSETTTATATFDNVYVGAPRLGWKTSWIGNSFNQASQGSLSGFRDDGYVQTNTTALWVAPDGKLWTNSFHDEAGDAAKIYADDATPPRHGRVVKTLTGTGPFGDNHAYEGSVTGDGTYVYVANQNNGWHVSRVDANGVFAGAVTFTSAVGQLSGMAASAAAHELYISDAANSRILVVDTTTLSEIPSRAFTFLQTQPGPIAVDARGNLWIIREGTPYPMAGKFAPTSFSSIYRYTRSGAFDNAIIADVVFPTALAIDPNQDRLLVAENGPGQNIRIYNSLTANTPTLAGTFGVDHGIYSGSTPGAVNDPNAGGMARFYGLNGVGVDGHGNLFVSSNVRGTDLRMFDSAGTFLWSLNSAGNDSVVTGDFDPATDGQDYFTTTFHYGLDYAQTAPGKEWSYKGFSYNPLLNDPDDRSTGDGGVTFVRRLTSPKGSSRFLYLAPIGGGIDIYRFDGPTGAGETAIPCGRIWSVGTSSGVGTTKLWIDSNHDGVDQAEKEEASIPSPDGNNGTLSGNFDVDSSGDIWWIDGPIIHFTLQSIDSGGVPVYSLSPPGYSVIELPAPFTPQAMTSAGIASIKYDRANDAMYLGGSTTAQAAVGIGAVIGRYDSWSTTQNNPKARYQLLLPNETTAHDFFSQGPPWAFLVHPFFKAFDVAGDFLFAWEVFGQVHVYDAKRANPVINLGPGPEDDGVLVWIDSRLAHAFKRSTNEYEIPTGDAGLNARNVLYRWTPQNDAAPPGPPTALTATADNGVIHLSWTGPRALLSQYRIYRGTSSGAETRLVDVQSPTYDDTNVTVGAPYFYRVTAINTLGVEGPPSNEATSRDLAASAVFVRVDSTTQGNWKGTYGGAGNWISGDTNYLPAGVIASINDFPHPGLPAGTTDIRALQQPAGTGRELSQWGGAVNTPFDVDLDFTDGLVHQVAFYVCDFGSFNLTQTVQIFDGASGAALDSRSISSFSAGEYLVWKISGHVKLHFLPTTNGVWSVLDGIFLDSVGSPLVPTDVDVGGPAIAGTETQSNGVFTIQASGTTIQNPSDQFNFAYQQIAGDCTITARLTGLTATSPFALGGVMIRNDLTSQSVMAYSQLFASGGAFFTYRSAPNGTSYSGWQGPNPQLMLADKPWFKVTRRGNTFTGYARADNSPTWIQVGNALTLTMGVTAYVGLAVCASNNTTRTTATLDNVTISVP